MSKAKDQSPTFEQAIQKLEKIIEQIESGQMPLEETLAAYEQGMKLIQHCRAILAAAEKKITELTVDEKGHLQERPSNTDADESSD